MGYGIDFDNDQAECPRCFALITPDNEACSCCLRCGGRGTLVSGLGAGKGTTRVECSACEGTGRREQVESYEVEQTTESEAA